MGAAAPSTAAGRFAWIGALARVLTRRQGQVFNAQNFFFLTEGRTFEEGFATFAADPACAHVLAARPDAIAILRDRARMAALPAGSLGHAYHRFMTEHGLDEGFYLEGAQAVAARFGAGTPRAWFRFRQEIGHDLRHVLTGYEGELLGEMGLILFRFAQTRHPGFALIVAMGTWVVLFQRRPRAFRVLREAYCNGRAARFLDLLLWEDQLDRPIEEIRAEFSIRRPEAYARSLRDWRARKARAG